MIPCNHIPVHHIIIIITVTAHSSESITILETIWKFRLFEISAHVFPCIYFIQHILSLYTQGTLLAMCLCIYVYDL